MELLSENIYYFAFSWRLGGEEIAQEESTIRGYNKTTVFSFVEW